MHGYPGLIRRYDNLTPTSSTWGRNNDYFSQAQRQKYYKSELSYYQSQSSHQIYEPVSYKSQPRIQTTYQSYAYNENLPVRVKSCGTYDYHTMLRVQILNRSEKTVNMIEINLTDDRNPKFLWKFMVRETEFMALKNDQQLKVDYRGFPEMLYAHLNICQSQKDVQSQYRTHFHLLFGKCCIIYEMKKSGEGVLSILESNKYKESVHLLLNFRASNDEQIKDYLSNKLIATKEYVEGKNFEIAKMQELLATRMEALETLRIQSKEEIDSLQKQLDAFRNEYQKKFNSLKKESLNEYYEFRRKFEYERRDLVRNKYSEYQYLKSKYLYQTKAYNDLKEKQFALESRERELTSRLSISYKEASSYMAQLYYVKTHNKDLETRRYGNYKTITYLSCKVYSLRSELYDKKSIISTHSYLKENTSSQIEILQDKTKEYKQQINKLEGKISSLENEVSKLNQTNKYLADKQNKTKLKLLERNEIIKDQYKYVVYLKKSIDELRRRESNLQRENQDLLARDSDKDQKMKNKMEQVEECQKKMQDQNDLIMHLQRQLNEKAGIRPTYYGSNTYAPSSLYSTEVGGTSNAFRTGMMGTVTASRITNTGYNTNDKLDSRERIDPVIKRYTDTNPDKRSYSRSHSPVPVRNPKPDVDYDSNPSDIRPMPVKFKHLK